MEVRLVSRRRARAQAFQKFQHAIPAVGLLAAGAQGLKAGAHGFELALALVEIVTSGLLIATLLRSMARPRARGRQGAHHAHGVDWIEIWAAGVLFAEAAERWHLTHHIPRPMILTALVTLGLGLFHDRIGATAARRRVLRVGPDGIYVSVRPFTGLTARWSEIADISVDATHGVIRTRAGRTRRLNLADLEDPAAVRAELEEAKARLDAARRDRSEDTAPAAGRHP